MHLAKGLESRAVAVMAFDDDVIPVQVRTGAIADEADLEDVYNTERHLAAHRLHEGTRPPVGYCGRVPSGSLLAAQSSTGCGGVGAFDAGGEGGGEKAVDVAVED